MQLGLFDERARRFLDQGYALRVLLPIVLGERGHASLSALAAMLVASTARFKSDRQITAGQSGSARDGAAFGTVWTTHDHQIVSAKLKSAYTSWIWRCLLFTPIVISSF